MSIDDANFDLTMCQKWNKSQCLSRSVSAGTGVNGFSLLAFVIRGTHVDCSQPSVFTKFYFIVEHRDTSRIERELDASAKWTLLGRGVDLCNVAQSFPTHTSLVLFARFFFRMHKWRGREQSSTWAIGHTNTKETQLAGYS